MIPVIPIDDVHCHSRSSSLKILLREEGGARLSSNGNERQEHRDDSKKRDMIGVKPIDSFS